MGNSKYKMYDYGKEYSIILFVRRVFEIVLFLSWRGHDRYENDKTITNCLNPKLFPANIQRIEIDKIISVAREGRNVWLFRVNIRNISEFVGITEEGFLYFLWVVKELETGNEQPHIYFWKYRNQRVFGGACLYFNCW